MTGTGPTSQQSPPPVTLVGHRWARHAHDLVDFLGGNHVPYRWLDMDRGHAAERFLAEVDATESPLPVAVVGDEVLSDPSVDELADALGMHVHATAASYDLGIVGAGPAGLAAAVYGGSEGLRTVLIEAHAPGGQAGTSSRIENYLGFPEGVSGAELTDRAVAQTRKFGVEIVAPQRVERMELRSGYKILHLADGSHVTCRALVVASGVSYRALRTPGFDRLAGAGVYYGAATTESQAAEGEHVFVIGSANSAGQGAMYFSRFAERVTVIFRGANLREHMSDYLVERIESTANIDLLSTSHVVEAHGEDRLDSLTIEDVASGDLTTLPARLLFVFVGAAPRVDWLDGLVATDRRGYVLCGRDVLDVGADWTLERPPFHLESNVPGVFCAGDARHGSIRRVAGAVGEGSTSVQLVHRYLAEHP